MSLHDIGNLAVCLAGILWGIEMIPQIIKTIKTKMVEGHSMAFYVMCYIAYLLYIFGNALLENWIIIWSHIPSYICTTIMVCLLIKYRKKVKKIHVGKNSKWFNLKNKHKLKVKKKGIKNGNK